MRTRLALLAFLGALALALAGCGGKAQPAQSQPTDRADQGAPAPAGSSGGQEHQGASGQKGNPDKGKEVFATHCAACHGADAKGGPGLVGPNLASADGKKPVRDRLSEQDHLTTVRKGRPEKGMPAWEGTLTEEQILDVVAYERSLN